MKIFYKCLFILLILINAAGLVSCGDVSEIEPVTNSLELNYSRWKKLGIDSYIITQQRMCFCVEGGTKMLVVVNDNKIVSVIDSTTSKQIPQERWQQYKTIDQLFETAFIVRDSKPARFDLRFDETYSFPNSIWIDPSFQIADEEYGYISNNFRKYLR